MITQEEEITCTCDVWVNWRKRPLAVDYIPCPIRMFRELKHTEQTFKFCPWCGNKLLAPPTREQSFFVSLGANQTPYKTEEEAVAAFNQFVKDYPTQKVKLDICHTKTTTYP